MVEESVWVDKEMVRPRLSSDELWLIYRLVDSQCWLLRRHPHAFWDFEEVAKLRRKLLRTLNRCRMPKSQISLSRKALLDAGLCHAININSLNAIPPKLIAKTISNTVMKSAFFQPNSLTKAAIVAMQGM
jgi:hypothetical protein